MNNNNDFGENFGLAIGLGNIARDQAWNGYVQAYLAQGMTLEQARNCASAAMTPADPAYRLLFWRNLMILPFLLGLYGGVYMIIHPSTANVASVAFYFVCITPFCALVGRIRELRSAGRRLF